MKINKSRCFDVSMARALLRNSITAAAGEHTVIVRVRFTVDSGNVLMRLENKSQTLALNVLIAAAVRGVFATFCV